MTPQVRLELEQLLSALCDGELTEPEHVRLEFLLNSDAECRRHYLEYIDLHASLLAAPGLPAGDIRPSTVTPRPVSHSGPRRKARRAAIYLTLIATTLVASFFVQLLWYHTQPGRSGAANGDGLPAAPALATLTQTVDCTWEGPGKPWNAGAPLDKDELRLAKGLARVRFQGGQDFVIEGPAVFKIEGPSEATLRRGRAVFRGDDTGPPFTLHTPSSTLIDMGTEYGVSVSPEDEEVHVFDGGVQRSPRNGGESERLGAGVARRYSNAADETVSCDESKFVRRMPSADRPNPEQGLLAHEGFDYTDADALVKGQGNGGRGWTSPWRGGPIIFGARPGSGFRPAGPVRTAMINPREGLMHPGESGVGGCFEYTGTTKITRRLASPISLEQDAVFYFSFLFRRDRPQDKTNSDVKVSLKIAEDGVRFDPGSFKRRISFGIGGWSNHVNVTNHGAPGACIPLPLSYGRTYLLVAKIVSHRSRPNEIFVRVYGSDEPVEREETMLWMSAGRPVQSDLTLDSIEVFMNGPRGRQQIDEIRLGTTWGSVTAPWSVPGN